MSGSNTNGPKGLIYPKPLPPFSNEETTDDFGFTANEKGALQNLIRSLKEHFNLHIFDAHNTFFTTNYELLERFRYYGHLDVQKLSEHYVKVAKMYETSINSLDSYPILEKILEKMDAAHMKDGVQRKEIALMTDAIKKQFLKVLRSISSPTMETALDKLSAKFLGSSHEGPYASSSKHSARLEMEGTLER